MDTFRIYNTDNTNNGIGCVYNNNRGSPKMVIYIEGRFSDIPYRIFGYVDKTSDEHVFKGRAIVPANPNEAPLPGHVDITVIRNPSNGTFSVMNRVIEGSSSKLQTLGFFQQMGQILMEKASWVNFNKLPRLTTCGMQNPIFSRWVGKSRVYLCVVTDKSGKIKGFIQTLSWQKNGIIFGMINDSGQVNQAFRCFKHLRERVGEACGKLNNYTVKRASRDSPTSLYLGNDRFELLANSFF